MAIVGSAHVVIRAITTRVSSDIQAGLRGVGPTFQRAGNQAGSTFRNGFQRAGNADYRKMFRNASRSAGSAGRNAGQLFGRAFDRVSNSIITNGQRGAQRRASGAGGAFGNAFASGFGRSGASRTFASIGLRIAALVPIIGALVAALSNVVSGLFAIGSAASSAAQSLVVIPSLLGAIVQGGAVMLGSFSGLGQALSAGMKSAQASTAGASKDIKQKAQDSARGVRDALERVKDAEREAARGVQDAARGIADAKRNLADAYKNAADAAEAASQQVSDAEDSLAEAHERVREAQEALTEARVEARERLIDLQFASQSGALAERRAAMELEDARWQLNAASELPVDNRLRQEAQLAYEEAKLNLDMIRESNGDNAKELNNVKKNGIDGMDEVVAAQDDLHDAQDGVKEAIQGVNDALESQRDTAADNARSIADAQRGVADAERGLADARRDGARAIRDAKEALAEARRGQDDANQAMAAGSTEAAKYQEELDKLSPPARRFVEYLISMRDDLVKLRTAGQAAMFPKLEQSLRLLVSGLFPSLERVMTRTGGAIGDAAVAIARDLTSGPFVASFRNVTDQNAVSIRRMGFVFGDLTRIVFALLDAARPLINTFTRWMVTWADSTRQTVEMKNRTGELTDTFDRSGRRMQVIIDIVHNLIEGIMDFGRIAAPSGMQLLRVLRDTTESFANFTDTRKHRRFLREFFSDTATNFLALSSLIKEVGRVFLGLSDNPSIANISKALEPTVKHLGTLIETMLNEQGTAIVDFINSIINTFTALSESGGLEIFLGILTGFFNTLTTLLQAPVIGTGLKTLLAVGSAMYALSIIRKFPGISILDRGLRGLWRHSGVGKAISTGLRNQIAGIVPTSRRMLDGMRLRMWAVRDAARDMATRTAASAKAMGSRLASGMRAGVGAAKDFIVAQGRAAKSLIGTAVAAARQRVAIILSAVATRVTAAATKAWAAIQAVFNAIMSANPIGIIIVALIAVGAALVLAYNKFDWFRKGVQTALGWVTSAFGLVVDAAKWLWDVLFGHSIFPDLLKGFRVIFHGIGRVVKVAVNLVIAYIRAWVTFFRRVVAPVMRWLWNNVVRPVFQKIGSFIGLTWNRVIKPALNALRQFINRVLIPIFNWLWRNVVRPVFNSIGKAIRGTWNDIVKPALQKMWGFFKNTLIPILNRLWNDVVKPTWNSIGDKIRQIWRDFVQPAVSAMRNFFTDKLIPAFTKVKNGITDMWDKVRDAAKAPVRFVVNTVWNNGLRKALNFIPGVNISPFTVNFAKGGILPGYTPGRDVHSFYSPTAGRLNLSGGEAVMRPEFTQALGPRAIQYINNIARRRGKSGVNRAMQEVQNNGYGGDIGAYAKGGVIPPSRIEAAQKFARSQVGDPYVWGGAGPNGFDCSGFQSAITNVIRGHANPFFRLGATASFPWAGFKPGTGQYTIGSTPNYGGSGVGHMAGTLSGLNVESRGGEGVVVGSRARGYSDSGFSIHYHLGSAGSAGGIDPRIEKGRKEKNNWLDLVSDIKNAISNVRHNITTLRSNNGEWWDMMVTAAQSGSRSAIQAMNDKIPNEIDVPGPNIPMPDNPIPNPFDDGGVARGAGYMPKGVITPERVLSTRQTQAFERLVDYLDGDRGEDTERQVNLTVNVPHEASPRDVIDGLIYEFRRYDRGGRYNR